MKSIVEQASSIAKAIEKGWERAGHPSNFTIKVLEQPEKNFFGLTVKSAKVALFFEEAKEVQGPARRHARGVSAQVEANRARHIQKAEKQVLSSIQEHGANAPKARSSASSNSSAHSAKPVKVEKPVAAQEASIIVDVWTDAMITVVQNWLHTTFKIMNLSDVQFSTSASGRHLTVVFAKPVYENKRKQRLLFSSFAHLIMETLRAQFKADTRGARIVLKSE
jgi:predicted RNA-binding protein Jag